jgi:fused signal recognition particle receptor
MARSWSELLGDEQEIAEPEEEQRRFLGKLRSSLGRTRTVIRLPLGRFDPRDDASWEELEEALMSADVGMTATEELVERLRGRRNVDDLEQSLVEEIADMLGAPGRLAVDARPSVVLFVGVNGTGKTTTIGKLAHRLSEHGHSVLVAAADTFRAAAGEQLEIWSQRAGADFVGSTRGADPAAVAYDAIDAAVSRARDVVLVDTAGRLHTQTNLMEELRKIRRVISDRLDGAPHETLLVLDSTTGQNGLRQARLFGEAVDVTGVALTKLDGTAKGGIVLPIAVELGLPVKLIGVGETLEDLRPFDPADFARALVGAEPE